MNDKEQLGEIKDRISKLFGYETAKDDAMYYMKKKHINWLLEQAEKVEQLQQEIEKLNQVIDWKNEGCEYNNESHLKTYNQLQQAQAKIERCKEIFKDIRDASSDIYALRKAEQALQTLEGEE